MATAVRPRTFFVMWALSMLPAAGFVALVERSDARKAEFVRLATGRAEGTVLRLIEVRGKNLKHEPIVGFTDAAGRKHEFRSWYGDYVAFGEKRFPVGARVSVLYVPAEPTRAEVDEPALRRKDATPFEVGGAIYAGFMTMVFGGLAIALRPRAAALPGPGPLAPS